MVITDTTTTFGRISEDSSFSFSLALETLGKAAKGFEKTLSLSNIGERLRFY